MADVFISYKREERDCAKRLAEKLAAFGFDVWWDFELLSGDRYRKVIERVIDECKAAIVVWSVKARESAFVVDEANYAHSMGKLCPVKVEDCRPPLGFGGLHVNNLIGWEGADDHAGFQALLRALEVKTGKRAAPGVSPRTREDAERATELEAFKAAQIAGSQSALGAFVAAYPTGAFTPFVQTQLAAFSAPPAADSAPALAKRRFDAGNYAFVSYPTDIAPRLLVAVVRALLARGLSIWLYDPSGYSFTADELARLRWQQSGGSWEGQTQRGIRRAAAVVALINEYSLQSRFQPREFELAVQEGKFVPCLISDLPYSALPPLFAGVHVARITPEILDSDVGRNRIAMLATDAEALISRSRWRPLAQLSKLWKRPS